VGAAVTLAGALTGTLIPQLTGALNPFGFNMTFASNANGGIVLGGTILTLIYFHFGARVKADGSISRFGFIELLAWLGRIFIGITLGVIFAGVYAAALTALIERILSLINFIGNFI
jgi:hypothetical protein